jgi:photosystem II stability/assembly factor-like uncharacterized protein
LKKILLKLGLIGLAILFSESTQISYSFSPPDVKSAIGTKENPMARGDYEMRLVIDPATGLIPDNMRKREIAFGKRLVKTENYLRASMQRTAVNNWETAGPFNVGGRTRGADIDINNSETIIAGGVSGGIWKTTDNGNSWKRTTEPNTHPGITSITQDKRSGKTNIWYAGTGELIGNSAKAEGAPFRGNGILKSIDNGNTWTPLESTVAEQSPTFNNQFKYIWNVVVNQKNATADEIYVAAFGGIVKSIDGGETWEIALGNKLFDLPKDTELNGTLNPFNTSIIQNAYGHFFATVGTSTNQNNPRRTYNGGGIFFSETGESWEEITPVGFDNYHERSVIGVSKSSKKIILLSHHDTHNSLWSFSYTSITNGKPNGVWQDLSDNIPAFGGSNGDYNAQEGYNMMVAIHPTDDNIVFIGGTNLYRSTNGFTTSSRTKWIGGYDPKNNNSQYPSHHADQHLLLFYPNNTNNFISCHDGGVSFSDDAMKDSVVYRSLNNGYLTSQFYTIAQQPDEATKIVMGGMQDNGSYVRLSNSTNPSWSRLISGDGTYVAIAPKQDFVYTGFQNGIIYRLNLNSDGAIRRFARVDPPNAPDEYLFVTPYILDPINANKMYLLGTDVIWRNRNLTQIPNGSQNSTEQGWEKIRKSKISSGIFTCIEKSQNILYAGVYSTVSPQRPSIVKVENAGIEEEENTEIITPDNFPKGGYMLCIAPDPDDAKNLMVVFSNYQIPSIFWSNDGGENFTDVSGNLEENPDGSGDGPSVRWAEIVPTNTGNKFFVGTSIGLYSTDNLDGQNTIWIKEGEESIGRAVVSMMDFRRVDGRMIVATHGNGTFLSYLPNAKQKEVPIAEPLVLAQNYPNPFDTETLIKFQLPNDGVVRIDIFNDKGQMIKNLLWGPHYAGANSVSWDGTMSNGQLAKPGLYLYHFTFDGKTETKRMILMH